MKFMLLALAAVMASVSALTVNLPLYSRAAEYAASGSTRFRLPVSSRQDNTSGVNVPVTDWFSRSDNQVSQEWGLSLSWDKQTDMIPQWYTGFSIGTPPQEM